MKADQHDHLKMVACFEFCQLPYVTRCAHRGNVVLQECKALVTHVEALFLFAFVWSVGCTVDEIGRRQFDAWLRCETASNTSPWLFPTTGTVSTHIVLQWA